MDVQHKTKAQLVDEITTLRQRVAELEAAVAQCSTKDALAVREKTLAAKESPLPWALQATQALQRRNRDLELLNRASRAINSTLNLDDVLVTVLEETRQAWHVAAGSVWLIDSQTDELVCRQAAGLGSEVVRGWRLARAEGIAGWVARHDKSLIVPDTLTDQRHFEGVGEQMEVGLRSLLVVPLRASIRAGNGSPFRQPGQRENQADLGQENKRTVIGVLEMVDVEADRFTETDLELAELLGSAAAAAIENARLYEQARQDVKTQERLVDELEKALGQVKALSGLLPICASCKKIRDDQGYWQDVAVYIRDHSEAEFSHGLCPDCAEALYPGLLDKDE
jgi:transcriptional regulator with GAF, ATPase, and Fis domain